MKNRGFTLIELLVVISIIALLSSVVLSSLNTARSKAKLASAKRAALSLDTALGSQAVGMWDFDECGGTTVADKSGNGNNGTTSGSPTMPAVSPTGTGCSLDVVTASSQYVNVPDSDSLDLVDNFTVSMWVYNRSANGQLFLAKSNSTVKGVYLGYGFGGNGFIFGAGWVSDTPLATSGADLNQWHHIVGVLKSGTRYLYLDGVLAGTATSAGASWSNTVPLTIGGGLGPGGTYYSDARLSRVRVYNTPLVASEVEALYAAEAPAYKLADR